MKLTTALTIASLILTSSFGFVNRVNAEDVSSHESQQESVKKQEAQEAQQESVKKQIEGVIQPQGWCWMKMC